MRARVPGSDAALALALFAVGMVEVLADPIADDVVKGPVALNVVALALATLPLAWRRVFPFAVAVGIFAAIAGRALAADPLEIYPPYLAALVATYSVAGYAPLRDAVVAAVVSALSLGIAVVEGSGGDASPDPIASLVLYSAVWLIGRVANRRNDRHAAEAVAAERERIARELHDAVSHSLATIVMQAGGAQNVLDRDPARARASLAAIERSGRQGLAEMRRLLGLLGPETADLAPQPGLARLDALLDQARSAGIAVTARVEGEARDLPAAVDVSAYRIVQEALTNAMKHAGRCAASVAVRYEPDALELEVVDDGRGAPQGGDGLGRGLTGMRERATLLGGTVEAGPRERAPGYRVCARLPLARPS